MKLRESGYVKDSVVGILKSGMTFYARKLKIDLLGGPPVNARNEAGSLSRKRSKLGASEQWFTRRRGGVREILEKENGWRRETPLEDKLEEAPRGRQTLTKYSTVRGPRSGRQGPKGSRSAQQQGEGVSRTRNPGS